MREMRSAVLAIARLLTASTTILSIGVFAFGFATAEIPSKLSLERLPISDPRYLGPSESAALAKLGIDVSSYATIFLVLDLVFFCVFAAAAFTILRRRSDNWMALGVSGALMLYGAAGSLAFLTLTETGIQQSPILNFVLTFMFVSSTISVPVLAYLFPDGHFVPRWTSWIALVWVVWGASSLFLPMANPYNWPPLYYYGVLLVGLASALFAQFHRYLRVSSPEEKLQTKWVVFGFALVSFIFFVLEALPMILPSLIRPGFNRLFFGVASAAVFYISQCVVPICIAFSIVRYRLWDIDIIINRTVVYVLVSGLLVLTFGIADRVLSDLLLLASATSGVSQFAGGLGSLLIVGLAFLPLRARTDEFVTRRFFGNRLEVHRAFANLAIEIRRIGEVRELLSTVLARLCAILGVAEGAVFLRDPKAVGEGGAGGQQFKLVESRNLASGDRAVSELLQKGKTIHQLFLLELLGRGDAVVVRTSGDGARTLPLLVPLSLPQSTGKENGELDSGNAQRRGQTGPTASTPPSPSPQILGALAMGPRLSGLGYSKDERILLLGLADQIAATIHFLRKGI